jgi:flagellar protein FlaG
MDITPLQDAAPVATHAATPASAEQVAANREVIKAVQAVNAAEMFGQDNQLTFVLDRGTQKTIIRVVDRKTNEVIRQIPAEYMLRLAEDARAQQRPK